MTVLDLQTIRYINLLDSASRVKTRRCFTYNNTIFFAVPKDQVSRAIGPNASNIRKIQEMLNKKVKIIAEALDAREAERFVRDIVSPVSFKSAEITENVMIINAGSQSKAALIGRNRKREAELKQIMLDNLALDLKIM